MSGPENHEVVCSQVAGCCGPLWHLENVGQDPTSPLTFCISRETAWRNVRGECEVKGRGSRLI